jgi:putative ABC transport system permease protein
MRSRLATARIGLRLAVRGLWYRRSTAMIVLVLAGVASAAAVVAPLYSRAAQESIVRDTLLQTDEYSRGVHVPHPQGDRQVQPLDNQDARFAQRQALNKLTHPAFGTVQVALQTRGTYHPTAGPIHGSVVAGRVVERAADVCAHLPTLTGRCPQTASEGIATRRTLALLGAKVGDKLPIGLDELTADEPGAPAPTLTITVVGSFDPVSTDDGYWVGQSYFNDYFPEARFKALKPVPPVADPVFLGQGTAEAAGITGYTVDVPLLSGRVHLDDGPTLQRQVERFRATLALYQLGVVTELPSSLDQADNGRELVRIASPLAVTQLVLLAWWTLFLVVGSATEERSPELGLAKLRGLSQRQTGRFGLAEILLLLVVAAPLGTVAGYVAVRAAGPHVFAPGTHVVFTSSVLLTVSIALFGGIVTAALAARQVFRRPVSDLLRRVPSRGGGRRGSLLEGVVITLAVAGTAQLVHERGSRLSPVAMLAPGMLAVVGGLLAGRLLVGVARNGSVRATQRGKAARLIGWCGVARRPGTARIASVLAIATCLLIIGVEAWTVAERNRVERSSAEVGAAVVLTVRAGDSSELMSAVRKADPGGRYAMAAVAVATSNQQDAVLAVDSSRADAVMRWGPPDAKPSRSVESLIAPPVAPSIVVRAGRLEVTATVARSQSPSPMTMAARLDSAGAAIKLELGSLVRGRHTYAAEVPRDCHAGCRLAALSIGHAVTDLGTGSARLSVHAIAAGPAGAVQPLQTSFEQPQSWHGGPETIGGPQTTITSGTSLFIDVVTPGGLDAEIVRGDAPDPLPAYAGPDVGRDPSEPGALPTVTAGGLSGTPTRYRAVHTGPLVPREGRAALLVDLELALRQSASAPAGDRQVWLARDDRDAERRFTRALSAQNVRVLSRETSAAAERRYAGDGAVLALRLLLVCGAAAVVVSVGALLVAAYVGRRQRAYEVAALRVVGLSRRTVRAMLLRENLGTVLVSLATGGAAALVATWVVLPSLPQFDNPSDTVTVRYAPDAASGWAALGGLGLVLGAVGLAVAALQLRAGRADRLREGVR